MDEYAKKLESLQVTDMGMWMETKPIHQLTKGNVGSGPYVKNNPSETKYAILPFERNDHIKRSPVGGKTVGWFPPTNISLSEIPFYEYNGVEDQIDALFANESKQNLQKT